MIDVGVLVVTTSTPSFWKVACVILASTLQVTVTEEPMETWAGIDVRPAGGDGVDTILTKTRTM